MQKREWLRRLPLVGLGSVLSLPLVSANALTDFGNMVSSVLTPIMVGFPGGQFELFGKILIWILAFAIFYAVTAIIPNVGTRRNIRMAISAVLAFMTVLPLTKAVLVALFQTYGILFTSILFFAPIAATIYLTHNIPVERAPRLVYAIRAIIFYIIASLIQNIVGATGASAAGT